MYVSVIFQLSYLNIILMNSRATVDLVVMLRHLLQAGQTMLALHIMAARPQPPRLHTMIRMVLLHPAMEAMTKVVMVILLIMVPTMMHKEQIMAMILHMASLATGEKLPMTT